MRRDDFLLDAPDALGTLSEAEEEMLDDVPDPAVVRELTEDLLFFHLSCARGSRLILDRQNGWSSVYVHKYREREHALAQASKCYLRLLDMGAQIPALLVQMINAEGGLTP